MKVRFPNILLISLILIIASCEDFLDQEPRSEISKEEALDDFLSLSFALNGAYNGLVLSSLYYAEFMMYYPDITGGNLKIRQDLSENAGEPFRELYNFQVAELSDRDNYEEMYEVLNSVNNVINAVPNIIDASQEEVDGVLGEALALRALIHFDLLRVFAQPYNYTSDASHPGIIVLTESPDPDEELTRSSVADGYNQVVRDLEDAISLLPNTNIRARFNQLSAKALLSRVFLYMEEWSRTASLANEVINDSRTALVDSSSYVMIWDNNYLGNEIILKILNNSNQNTLSDLFGTVPGEVPILTVTTDYENLLTDSDVRSRLIQEQSYDEGTYRITTKYPYQNLSANAVPVLRLSEIYLNRAEAYAELNREELALADLNTIIQRADPSAEELILSGQDLLNRIFEERRKELAFEGHLLFDLNRNKRDVIRSDCNPGVINCNLAYPDYRYIQPFPLGAISGNRNLVQNEGY